MGKLERRVSSAKLRGHAMLTPIRPDTSRKSLMPKSKILIVDDEPTVRNMCAAVLRNRSFDPIVTANGLEGLAAFLEAQEDICLVISDVKMPFMDGIEMVKR